MDEQTSLFQRPVVKTLIRFGAFALIYLVLYIASPGPDPLDLILDLFLFVVGAIVWMMFFAQFVLPVKKISARLMIMDRLVSYLSGYHGPALFIENGVTRSSEGETKKRGPGVIWLDSASAAMLRTPVKFTRAVGPGVYFTRYNEYVAGTVDLHRLTQSIGPNDDDDPYTVDKNNPENENIQKRRYETSALTRDSIEVVATLTVTYRIKAAPNEGGTPFGFNEDNVRKYVTESLMQGAQADRPLYTTLPAKMAVDVWREYLRKFKLTQLFEIAEGQKDTTLQIINRMLKKRLSEEKVEVLDEFGRFVEGAPKEDSKEFQRLDEMGIEVISAIVKRVIFSREVEDRLVSQWTTLWLKNAQKEREQVESNRKLIEERAREDALKEFAVSASAEISREAPDERASKTHALEMLVHSSFLEIRRNTSLLRRTSSEQRELADIVHWLREKRGASNNDSDLG